ncbi:hypothetical protein BH18ACT12_BH18ACT12_18480 [soil metagenome]
MPFNKEALQAAIASVHRAYMSSATAVRTGGVISPLHEYCAAELRAGGLPTEYIHPPAERRTRSPRRLRILGGYMPKEIDVCLIPPNSGPLLAISVKSQMSSIVKNTINRFEEYVGDATNLHTRFPMLVLGFLMLVPVANETFAGGKPTAGLTRIASLLERANARQKVNEPPGSYEASALLLVDFTSEPPRVVTTFPNPRAQAALRIETFFDRLVTIYHERNQFV